MKRKLMSMFLAFVMVLTLLPGTALAADNSVPKELNVPNTVSWSIPTIDGRTITDATYRDKVQVLIFYDPTGTCGYSNNIISSLAGGSWTGRSDAQVIAIGVADGAGDAAARELVTAHRDKYAPDCTDVEFAYMASNATLLRYLELCGYTTTSGGYIHYSWTWAVVCIIDTDNNIRYSWMKASDNQNFATCLDKIAGIEVPDVDPTQSGSSRLPKLSKEEIAQLLEENPLSSSTDYFVTQPTFNPYTTGQIKTERAQEATDRLNALRRLAGLPEVKMDAAMNELAQYGAVLLAASTEFDHVVPCPPGMPDSFYQKALSATTSSNIAMGTVGFMSPTLSVDGFMDDSDAYNLRRLGHRRWQLNPTLGKTGFGYAVNNGLEYVDEESHDMSGGGCDYAFIGWPASGYFPNNMNAFNGNTAWSVTLSPDRYRTPSLSSVRVTLARESDGKTWSFSGSESYTLADSGKFFNVNTDNVGIPNCIIFRPDGVSKYEGVYTVTITGLTDISGAPATLSYQVDFFDPSVYQAPPAPPSNPCTFYFDANGGSGSMDARQVPAGSVFTFPPCSFTAPAGKEFDHWEVNGRPYAPGATAMVNSPGQITVLAVWRDITVPTCTVSFDSNGGSGSMDARQVPAGSSYSLPACSFTAPAGKEFDHWEVNGRSYAPGSAISVSSSVTVRAVWRDKTPAPGPSTGPSSGSAFRFEFDFSNMNAGGGSMTFYILVYMNGLLLLSIPVTLNFS